MPGRDPFKVFMFVVGGGMALWIGIKDDDDHEDDDDEDDDADDDGDDDD